MRKDGVYFSPVFGTEIHPSTFGRSWHLDFEYFLFRYLESRNQVPCRIYFAFRSIRLVAKKKFVVLIETAGNFPTNFFGQLFERLQFQFVSFQLVQPLLFSFVCSVSEFFQHESFKFGVRLVFDVRIVPYER